MSQAAAAQPRAVAGEGLAARGLAVRGLTIPGGALAAQHWLALAAVATLPFAYAMTLDLRFPFKLYELALVVGGVAVLAAGRVRAAPGTWRALRLLWPFVAYVGVVLAARTAYPPPTLNLGTFLTRFGPAGDGITKYCYLLLAVFGLTLCSYAAFRDERLYTRVWLAGSAAAALYTWFLFLSSLLGVPPLLLPGMKAVQFVTVAGREVIRSGTFLEGNHLGLYLVCSVAVAAYARRYAAALLLSLTTVITFSTANVIGLAVLWFGVGWSAVTGRRRGARRMAAALAYVALAVGAVVAFASTRYATEIVVNKLRASDSASRLDRLDQTIAGLRMAADYPVAGVGLSQYGYHYRTYQVTTLFGQGERMKGFPNNVYVELLSETGVVGTLLIATFWAGLYRRTRGLPALRWGLVAMLLVFGTFPTFTVMFLWAYWALIIAAAASWSTRPGGRASAAPA